MLLTTWEAAYRTIGWSDYIFPAPSHVLDSVMTMLHVPTGFGEPLHPGWPKSDARPPRGVNLVGSIAISLTRLVVGFAISIVLGIVIGLAMWRSRTLDEFLGPLFL